MKRLALFCVSFFIFGLMFVTLSNAKIDFKTAAGIGFLRKKTVIPLKILLRMGITEKLIVTKHIAASS